MRPITQIAPFIGTNKSPGEVVVADKIIYREPNLLIPGKKPVGNVKLSERGIMFLCRQLKEYAVDGVGRISANTSGLSSDGFVSDADSDYVQFDSAAAALIRQPFPFTYSLIFKLSQINITNMLFYSDDVDGGNYAGVLIYISAATNKIRIRYGDNTGDTSEDRYDWEGTTAVVVDKWYNLAFSATAYNTAPNAILNGANETFSHVSGTGAGLVYNNSYVPRFFSWRPGIGDIFARATIKSFAVYPNIHDTVSLSRDPYQFLISA